VTKGVLKVLKQIGAPLILPKMNNGIWVFCREEKIVCSFFGRICGAQICLRIYLTITESNKKYFASLPNQPKHLGYAR